MKNTNQELSTSQLASKFNISAIKLNKILAKSEVIIKRGRPAKSEKGKYRPYWWINNDFISYGYNKLNVRGGSSPIWYEWRIEVFKPYLKKIIEGYNYEKSTI